MLSFLRQITKNLPTFLLAFIMACAVWVTAVTASDPNQTLVYPTAVSVNLFGLGPGLIMGDVSTQQVHVTLLAPQSVWTQLNQGNGTITARADITGLDAGTHTVPIRAQVNNVSPVEIIKIEPATVTVTLEKNATRTLPLSLTVSGSPATGYDAGTPSYTPNFITVSGPQSLVQQVYKLTATISVDQAQSEIRQTVSIQAVDINNNIITGLVITPGQVTVSITITQKGGYKNVSVKLITTGTPADGYRTTNYSVNPPVVTVFSTNPTLVDNLPGYVETNPLDLTGAHDDISAQVGLNLPDGVSVVGNQTVTVQVGIAAIEDSITLSNMPVKLTNMGPDLAGSASPTSVDVILSGPLLILNQLTANQVHVTIDMSGKDVGEYQVSPSVTVDIPSINVESINPSTIQVTVISATATPTATLEPGQTRGTPVSTGTPGILVELSPTPTATPKP